MYEYLEKLFGTTEDGQPEALTFTQLVEKLGAADGVKIANIAEGGYVSKDKLDAKITELKGVQKQLEDANAEIKSYKDMDIEGIKQKAAEWESKYEKDTQALKDQLASQETEFAAKTYLGSFEYANELVRDAIYAKFMEKGFKREGDKFLGADDFMAEMKAAYPSGFVSHDPEPEGDPAPQSKPQFSSKQPPAPPQKKRSLLELMKYKNEHPEAQITYD